MFKEFNGLKKRHFCLETSKKFYKHGEVTTCVLGIFIPVTAELHTPKITKYILGKFPQLKWDYSSKAEYTWGFSATIVATAIPTIGDIYNEKLGETISYSKCQKKAYSITSRVLERLACFMAGESVRLEMGSAFMDMCREREFNFLDSL